jgi:hypothetical protein
MARRRLAFKPSLRDTQLASVRAMKFYAGAAPEEKRAAAEAHIVAMEAAIKPKRERAAPRKLEAPVVAAISELLAVHPRVLFAVRINSGAAGEFSHVWFHKWIRPRTGLRMSDFIGIWSDGVDKHIPFAIEAKAPGWKKPTDQRELEQAAFLAKISDVGGIALFATSADQVAAALQ